MERDPKRNEKRVRKLHLPKAAREIIKDILDTKDIARGYGKVHGIGGTPQTGANTVVRTGLIDHTI
ncbi:MAG TPA: hypothetical protein VKC53_00725 [Patescibacteria group bacterium]|nr:hypothetical protein [Patescibacteria group bacterium]